MVVEGQIRKTKRKILSFKKGVLCGEVARTRDQDGGRPYPKKKSQQDLSCPRGAVGKEGWTKKGWERMTIGKGAKGKCAMT